VPSASVAAEVNAQVSPLQVVVNAAFGAAFAGGAAAAAGVNSRWLFAVPAGPTIDRVRSPASTVRTSAGVAPGRCSRTSAAAPAVCGAAIEVPLIVADATSEVCAAEVIETPGANQSTQLP
jgi:hypothetical protein